jgi:hypothetical protein
MQVNEVFSIVFVTFIGRVPFFSAVLTTDVCYTNIHVSNLYTTVHTKYYSKHLEKVLPNLTRSSTFVTIILGTACYR